MARAKALGDAHEQRYLRSLRLDRRVVGVDRPRETSRAAYEQAADATLLALASDADVVYQAAFFDGRFHGFADFVVREPTGWTIVDTKLARTESVPALLQIAAYAVQLADAGVPDLSRRPAGPRRRAGARHAAHRHRARLPRAAGPDGAGARHTPGFRLGRRVG